MNPGQTLLITGGTGSFGKTMLRHILDLPREGTPGKIVILSRDEDKQYAQRHDFPDERIHYVIGDIRDRETCIDVMKQVDIVIHAAALKQVPTGEYFPLEMARTNILGTANLVDAALDSAVSKFIILSTDKAVYPINAYGMSKALAEKILIAAAGQSFINGSRTKFCVVRYGNVIGSRGSVIPLFLKQIQDKGEVTITDGKMTRFLLKLDRAINLVAHVIEKGEQGRVYVKKAPACTVEVLAQALELHYGRRIERRQVGIRPGEKIHETLITADENGRSEDEADTFDNEPITAIRSYFECKMTADADLMARYKEPLSVASVDYTSRDAKQLNPEETLALLRDAGLLT
jgi:UDP-N-acetylglucosamine 4,6-dehydratase